MSDTDNVAEAPPGELALDPFSYHPDMASAIGGLGGGQRHPDPDYAFHTDYVPAAEGACHFTVRFAGLEAKIGTLQLRVHMFVESPRPRLLLANTMRIQFNRLISQRSEIAIRFDGFAGVKFALHGAVLGRSDAHATSLSVTLDRPAGVDLDSTQAVAELRNTDYGTDATRAEPTLITLDAPTLASPVSQAGTTAQLREPVARKWIASLHSERAPERAQWCAAYVMQALRSYGMLHAGASGLGVTGDPDPIRMEIERADAHCATTALPGDPDALPGTLVNFDFLWTVDELARGGVGEAVRYADALMRCLRPGGVAIHVVPFLPGLEQRGSGDEATTFRRGDVERLALQMIARRFETAQIKIDHRRAILGPSRDHATDVAAFGMVFRKPALAGA